MVELKKQMFLIMESPTMVVVVGDEEVSIGARGGWCLRSVRRSHYLGCGLLCPIMAETTSASGTDSSLLHSLAPGSGGYRPNHKSRSRSTNSLGPGKRDIDGTSYGGGAHTCDWVPTVAAAAT